jgi:hypothetical protein
MVFLNNDCDTRVVGVVARSEREYATAIIRARSLSHEEGVVGIPVIAQDHSRLTELCSLLNIKTEQVNTNARSEGEHEVGNNPIPWSKRWVLCEQGPVEQVARMFADATCRSLFVARNPDELVTHMLSPDRSGVVLAIQGSPTFEIATEFIAGFRGKAPEPGSFGILAARSLTGLSFLTFKILAYQLRATHGSLLVEAERAFVASPGKGLLSEADSDSVLRRALSEHFELVSFIAHGDNIDAGVGADTLCGRRPDTFPASLRRSDPDAERPPDACLSAGHCKRQIGRATTLVFAGDIKARILFAASCSGIPLARSAFTSDLWLVFAALEGYAEAWIASAKLVRPVPAFPRIVHAALGAGLTLGEICSLIDRVQRAVWPEMPGFVLFGDPETRTLPRSAVCKRKLVGPHAFEGVDFSLYVARAGSGVSVDYLDDVPKLHQMIVDRTLRLKVDAAEPRHVVCGALPGASKGSVELWSFFLDENPNGVSVRFEHERKSLPDLARVERGVAFLDRLFDVCADPAGDLRPTEGLRVMVEDMDVARHAAQLVLKGGKRIWESLGPVLIAESQSALPRVESLKTAAEIGERALVHRWPLWDVPVALYPFYNRHIKLSGMETPDGPPCTCGMQAFSLRAWDPARPEIMRYLVYCPRCALIADESSDLRGGKLITPRSIKVGVPSQVSVQLPSLEEEDGKWYAALRLENPGHWVHLSSEPAFQELPVGRDCVRTMDFTVTVAPGSVSGTYYLQAVVVSNFAFSVLQTPVWVIM